ncbi:MAG: SPOR domain-containing protein [Planktotalea sp.]|uniref:SPOR domain-containing protein n=1 Tax=Planktotalea sp. TaxID=2029877 RepID=UPI003C79362E
MNFKRFFAVSLLAATCAFTFSEAGAQSLTRDAGPAEIPPASFKGNQYVDSKGCVYIRAGVDGNTNWVPRVARSRKVVCGLSPSLAGGGGTAVAATAKAAAPVEIGVNSVAPKSPAPSAVAAATPTVRPARTTVAEVLAPKPVRTVASKPAVRTVRPAPTPKVQRVNIPQPSGVQLPQQRMQTARVQAPAVQQVQPRVIRVAPQAQNTTTARRVAVQPRTASTQTCQGASAVSQRYIGGRGTAVRCGPQAGSIVTTRAGDVRGGTFRSADGQIMANVSPNARVVPRHVHERQQASRVTSPTPKGYRKAWEDDRLNPNRANQTLAGKAQTDLIWTQTVPRRLIVRSTGRDVTRSFPGLLYPYTSEAQQAAAINNGAQIQRRVVSSKGTTTKRVVRQPAAVQQAPARVVARAASAPRKVPVASGNRFIQVGTFGVAGNAQNTAQRLQRMGLPVRIGKFTRAGKPMSIVLAGPFGSSAHTNGALTAVRNAGFRDAFARN